MSEPKQALISDFEPPHSSFRSYAIGFVTCIVLTVAAYIFTTSDIISNAWAVGIVAALAIVQCIVQLTLFLHLGTEARPRWKLGVFILMVSIVLIIVGGSIWIMDNLNYRMMHSADKTLQYVNENDSL